MSASFLPAWQNDLHQPRAQGRENGHIWSCTSKIIQPVLWCRVYLTLCPPHEVFVIHLPGLGQFSPFILKVVPYTNWPLIPILVSIIDNTAKKSLYRSLMEFMSAWYYALWIETYKISCWLQHIFSGLCTHCSTAAQRAGPCCPLPSPALLPFLLPA